MQYAFSMDNHQSNIEQIQVTKSLRCINRRQVFGAGFLPLLALWEARAAEREPLVFSRQVGVFDDEGERLLREAYQRIGIEVQATVLPGERGLISANDGITDGELNRIAGLESIYTNLVMVPVAVSGIEAVALVHNARFTVDGWDSLRNLEIGIRKGTKFAEKGTMGMKVQVVAQYPPLLQMLARERVQVVVGSRATLVGELQKMREAGQEDVVKGMIFLEPPIDRIKTYHYLHNRHLALLPQITKALQDTMRKRG